MIVGSVLLAACTSSPADQATKTKSGDIRVVAAENEYGNVASQIGGRYVSVTSVESNPNTDPHTYEVSPGVAQAISSAQLVIQNGVGYDDFMTKIESASANPKRRVINVQHLLGLPDSTPNPHLWYSPKTMPKVATALADDLSTLNRSMPPTSKPEWRPSWHRSFRGWRPSLISKRLTRTRPWPRPNRSPTTCWKPPARTI